MQDISRGMSLTLIWLGSLVWGLAEALLQDRFGILMGSVVAATVVALARPVFHSFLKAKMGSSPALLVYADSPLWTDYIERQWLPALGGRMKVWKLSPHRAWQGFVRSLFLESLAPVEPMPKLPMVVVFREKKKPLFLGFHDAFLDLQAGDAENLRNRERRLALETGERQWLDGWEADQAAATPFRPADQALIAPSREGARPSPISI